MARTALLLALPALALAAALPAALPAHGAGYDPGSIPELVELAPGEERRIYWTVINPSVAGNLTVTVSLSGPGAGFVTLPGGGQEQAFEIAADGTLDVPLLIGAPASGTYRVTVRADDAAPAPAGRMGSTPGAFQEFAISVLSQGTEAVADVVGTERPAAPAPAPRPAPRSSSGGGSAGMQAGGAAADVYIESVSWDCGAGSVEARVGPADGNVAVTVRTTLLGVQGANDAGAEDGLRTFVARMAPDDDLIVVQAISLQPGSSRSATETVDVDACEGEDAFGRHQAVQPDAPGQPAAPAPAPAPEPTREIPPPPPPRVPDEAAAGQADEPPAAPAPGPAPEPAPAPPGAGDAPGGGCLIATAAYGTEMAPQVQLLREARGGELLSTGAGAQLMGALHSAYYSFSPAAADLQRGHPELREAARIALSPALHAAQAAAGLGAGP